MINFTQKNRAFWAKSKARQRVLVAKDVLKQIESKFYVPKKGTYMELNFGEELKRKYDPYFKDADWVSPIAPAKLDNLLSELKQNNSHCEVCGLGACFASLVNLGDTVKTKSAFSDQISNYDEIDSDIMKSTLRKVFTHKQISLIECAFEKSNSYNDEDHAPDTDKHLADMVRAVEFGERFEFNKDRLSAIMQNIIENAGTFKP